MRPAAVGIVVAGMLAALLFLVSAPPPAPAEPAPAQEDVLAPQVREAIKKGKAYLRRQEADGSWDRNGKIGVINAFYPPGGTVGLAMLALLTCGVEDKDDQAAVQAGLDRLRQIRPSLNANGTIAQGDASRTYAVALQTMVYVLAGQAEDKERIQENVNWLLNARARGGNNELLGWSYAAGSGDVWDASNTQYALLALHEAVRSGARVDKASLESIQKFYLKQQHADGGWGYVPGHDATMTMTTAGVCGLLITGMDLEAGKQKLNDDGSADNCGVYDDDTPVAKGLKWIGDRLPADGSDVDNATMKFLARVQQDVGTTAPFYGFYGIERTGRLTGQRFIAGHDWYRVGCRFLIKTQNGDGSWAGPGIDGEPIVATSFALLFLAKGRTPVLMTKLAYGQKGDKDWNHKHNDLRNLVEYASREMFKKQPMAWQIFDTRERGAENDEAIQKLTGQLLESPIVWLSGHGDDPGDLLTGGQEGLLKEYLENGGFVFAEACCNSEAFDRKFRALMKRVYPDADLKLLDQTHPIYSASGHTSDAKTFPLWGIERGCKTIVAYSPHAISGYWEANDTTSDKGRKAFELADNVIAYATGLEPPRQKGDSVKIVDTDKGPIKRGFLKTAQLMHDGVWQPAPKAMHSLMVEARAAGLDVALEPEPIHPSNPDLVNYPFMYMHGRNAFSYKPSELERLRFTLEEKHGLLFADACCGSKTFDEAFRKFMDELWANHKDKPKLEPIPPDDELYSEELNGKGRAIKTVMCRRERPDGSGADKDFQQAAPALEGVKINGRWVVVYSRYDIGCALEHHPTPGCLGHDYDSAIALGRAVVLYALK